jgi:uncharacterized protein YdaU (DUF1376 family)
MNYFELHLGDYAEATAHLTFVEDAAYGRMLRKYYATEKPLPADLKQVQRLVGARTKEEKNAVQAVLEEFFSLQDDGWHNARCDAEIAKFQDGEPEREAKKSNEEARLKRHREERARLFSLLNKAGLHAPWNIGMNELREMVKGLPATAPETQVPPLPATAPATPATATQSPVTNHQTPVLKPNPSSSSQASTEVGADQQRDDDDQPRESKRVSAIVTALRGESIEATAGDAIVLAWAADTRVTKDVLLAAIAKAKKFKPGEDVPLAYLDKVVQTALQNQNAPATVLPAPAQQALTRKPQGNDPKGTDESYEDWQARVAAFERAQRNGDMAA